jgi:hypothetical protein
MRRRQHEAALETVEAACDDALGRERRLAAQGWRLYDQTLTNLNLTLARVQELEDQQNAALDMLTNHNGTVIGVSRIKAVLS